MLLNIQNSNWNTYDYNKYLKGVICSWILIDLKFIYNLNIKFINYQI